MRRFTFLLMLLFALGAASTGYVLSAQAAKEPGTVILKGAPMGGVKFDHTKHTKELGAKCETCHHASKAEMPNKAANQKCTDCHTKTAAAPMKTKLQAAFHDPMAKKGTCVDCHAKENAGGKKAPLKLTMS